MNVNRIYSGSYCMHSRNFKQDFLFEKKNKWMLPQNAQFNKYAKHILIYFMTWICCYDVINDNRCCCRQVLSAALSGCLIAGDAMMTLGCAIELQIIILHFRLKILYNVSAFSQNSYFLYYHNNMNECHENSETMRNGNMTVTESNLFGSIFLFVSLVTLYIFTSFSAIFIIIRTEHVLQIASATREIILTMRSTDTQKYTVNSFPLWKFYRIWISWHLFFCLIVRL